MAKVVREDIDKLNAVLTVTIEKADYEPKLQSELNKYRKSAHMKGFRKGKTPLSVLKKMYGKGVLADVINQKLQSEIANYLTENKIDILGQPLPNKDQEEIDFDLKQMENYEFRFDLGLAPEFEVQGVSEDSAFEKLEVEVPAEEIEKEFTNLRKQQGKQGPVEGPIEADDILKLKATELAGGGIPKPDGHEGEFSVLVSRIGDEEIKASLLGKKTGDSFRAELLKLEAGIDENYVRKYYLGLEEDDEKEVEIDGPWELTITEVTRLLPAEVNQEFLDKAFGPGEVQSEEEAKEKIREGIAKSYDNQAESLLFRDFQEALMEKNEMDLPEEFLNRWILATNEEIDEDRVKLELPGFVKNLKWTLIKNKLGRRFEIKVEEAEIRNAFAERIRGYFGGSPYANEGFIDNMVDRLMDDVNQYNQVVEEVVTDKLHEAIKGVVTIKTKSVSLEEFKEITEEARKAAQAARNVMLELEGEEE